jgi:hypothetical protein
VTITFIFAFMIISSPVFMLANPNQVLAATPTRVDSSGYHSTPLTTETASPSSSSATPTVMAPSTSNQERDFTTQAALTFTRATQTNNIVNSKSYYDIMFRTTTAGIIKAVEMDFPDGTYVGIAVLVETTGIGPGTIARDNVEDKITYTVTNPVNVPANTRMRIQLSDITNPSTPSSTLTVSITTRDPANAIIDGPTTTGAYKIKQVGTADIADNSVTTPKIADDAVTDAKLSAKSAYILWYDNDPGNEEVFYKRSAISFDPTVDISNNVGVSSEPTVATSGNNVYVVWMDNTDGNFEIFYKSSTDGGANFGATVNVSNNAGTSSNPEIAVANNLPV